MKLPGDSMMLYNFIDIKLRDFYPSLDVFRGSMNVERSEIARALRTVGFEYNPV